MISISRVIRIRRKLSSKVKKNWVLYFSIFIVKTPRKSIFLFLADGVNGFGFTFSRSQSNDIVYNSSF